MTVPARATVLLVDDDEVMHIHLQRLLRGLSAAVELLWARDGAEALEALEGGGAPDLVLLDLSTPELSGAEVLARLAEEVPSGVPPILIHSATTDPGAHALVDRFECVVGFAEKPIGREALASALA